MRRKIFLKDWHHVIRGKKKKKACLSPALPLAEKKPTERLHHADSFTLRQASDKILRGRSPVPAPTVTSAECAVSEMMKAA